MSHYNYGGGNGDLETLLTPHSLMEAAGDLQR